MLPVASPSFVELEGYFDCEKRNRFEVGGCDQGYGGFSFFGCWLLVSGFLILAAGRWSIVS